MKWQLGTDVGCVRVSNEDSFGYDLDRGIFVVCDGMGGHASGDVASKLAVESLLTYFRQRPQNTARHDTEGTTRIGVRGFLAFLGKRIVD